MSSTALMSLGLRGLAASYAALQTTGQNISNANVAGYSRQQVVLSTSAEQFSGSGYIGRGVDVSSVTRAHDDFLTREAVTTQSAASMDSAQLTQLRSLEGLFQTGDSGLGNSATQVFDAMVDLSSHPNDNSSRQVVLARASDMATRFSQASAKLDDIQSGVTAALTSDVSAVNSLTHSIAEMNQRISLAAGQGQPPNDLLDQRDLAIGQLAQHIDITRLNASDGSATLLTSSGQTLVLGAQSTTLEVQQDRADPQRSAISVKVGGANRPIDSNTLAGGSIAGLLNFQNKDLAAGRSLIGRMALAVGGAINQQQLRGVSLQTPLGTVAASAMFSFGPTKAIANAGNAVDSTGNPIASVALGVVDTTALQPSDYDLRESPTTAGSWQLTRLSDGKVRTVNNGDVVDGFSITINNAQPGDSWRLQPVSNAAGGMSALLSDPRDVAAASPLVATTSASNTGTTTVDSLTITAAPLPTPRGTSTITFTDNQGGYAWSTVDSTSALVASGTGTWTAGGTIPAAPNDINGFSLRLTGVPRSGDVVSVDPTASSALSTNNGNALALAALRDAQVADGHSATDVWADAMADVGVRVQSAQSRSDISTVMASQAEQARSAVSGVNLDEEAARLIQYQQSYQAAAKVLQTAQAVFDTLLQTVGAR
jgi:flagellar hook-associated protein 1 FlgK